MVGSVLTLQSLLMGMKGVFMSKNHGKEGRSVYEQNQQGQYLGGGLLLTSQPG